MAAVSAQAQTVDPNVIEYLPSAQHWTTLPDGQPAISKYLLTFYQAGSSSAVLTLDLGKPVPQSDGMIRVDYATMFAAFPLPNSSSEARVTAVGSSGSVISDPSNSFAYNCNTALAAGSAVFASNGGSGSTQLTTATHCGWTASSPASWVVVSSSNGVGSSSLGYTVAPNPSSSARSAVLTIGGAAHTVSQAANVAPTVGLTSPANGSSINKKFVTVSADATDADGISRVEFFANGQRIQSVATAPYSFRWAPANGSYQLLAVAYDRNGLSTQSAPVSTLIR